MKILLINPPVEDFFFTPQRAYPLGILYLATVLDKAGFKVNPVREFCSLTGESVKGQSISGGKPPAAFSNGVKILNCTHDFPVKKALKLPTEFSYLKRYYHPNKSPFRLFSHYYHFGADDLEIKRVVKEFSPHIVGISANFSPYFDSSLLTAKLIKQVDKRITVVLGGRVPTIRPQLGLNSPSVDFILRGEAEFTFLELCRSIKEGKSFKAEGLCYKNDKGKVKISSRIAIIKDLNTLPVLNRRLFDYQKHKFQGLVSASLLTCRGCRMKCKFCAINEPFRYRRAQNVIEEMEDCFSLGIRHFNFEDDNINLNPEFEKLIEMIGERFKGEIKLSFMNGTLSRGISSRLADKLVTAGLTHLDLSMATSDKNLRKKINRSEDIKGMFKLASLLSKKAIPVTVHYIVALPQQKFKGAVRDIRYLAAKPVILGPSIFYPVIESMLFKELKEKFSITEQNYLFFRSSTAYFDKFITREHIFLLFYCARIINFIKEFIDEFVIEEGNFATFLKDKVQEFTMENNMLYSQRKLERYTLGIILLDRLFKEYQIYRVQEGFLEGKFCYCFIREDFVSSQNIKYVLSGLSVRGIKGTLVHVV